MIKGDPGTATPIVLVDGHNLLWRATFGFPARIRSRCGIDRTSVFGFFALLKAATKQLTTAAEWVVCFDGQLGTQARLNEYSQYKAGRPVTSGEADPIAALPLVKSGLDYLGITWIEIDDQEADDVIATLARREVGRDRYVMSTDKDYYQLVDDSMRILNTALKRDRRILDGREIMNRHGVTPRQWCDFRALTGDPGDNILGVPGIGKVRAARLLSDGVTLEDIPRLGRLVGKLGETLRESWPDVLRNRELIRLRTVDLLPQLTVGAPHANWINAGDLLERLHLW
jgi:DNA polymerase-1